MEEMLTATMATIRREGQYFLVDGEFEPILRRVLHTRVCSGHQTENGALMIRRRRKALYEREYHENEKLKFLGGLIPIVSMALRDAGIEVRPFGARHANLPAPVRDDRSKQRQLLDHIAANDRGLIIYNADSVNPAHLVAQVARAWPDLFMTLITSRIDDANNIAEQLRGVAIDAIAFTGKNQRNVKARVAVCTPAGTAYNPTELEKQDIVFYLDAVAAFGKEPLGPLGCLQFAARARLYGFLGHSQQLSPHDLDMIRCVYGFREVFVPWHRRESRPIEVAWALSKGRQLRYEVHDAIALKKHGIWNNDHRNRQIAKIARAFANGDGEALAQTLFEPKRMPEEWQKPRNTYVIVENFDHAMKFVHKLPGWTVLASGLLTADRLSAAEHAVIWKQGRPLGPCGIVTHAGMLNPNMPWDEADVLIRADAGTGLLELPVAARVLPITDVIPSQLTVVDFFDTHDADLQKRSRQRQMAYGSDGWLPRDVDHARYRAEKFLKSRSRRRSKGGKS